MQGPTCQLDHLLLGTKHGVIPHLLPPLQLLPSPIAFGTHTPTPQPLCCAAHVQLLPLVICCLPVQALCVAGEGFGWGTFAAL